MLEGVIQAHAEGIGKHLKRQKGEGVVTETICDAEELQ